ncbi:single-stranded DNA-binding protein [Suid betaherpesvirus 2]|uniref:Single-stranded DNA-binding protein n=1 Tax=Suid betaherpesvirus 2 TaxID=1608255 RepID=U3GQ18_9BETA|nr:single-stranded DNA-binding protein [Suid betaherpesvirus 2]AGT99235.1 single-stranded DNA-binding protein [Suid betaherpesvirus 2]
MADDGEISTSVPITAAAWLYVAKKEKEMLELISALSLSDRSSSVVIAPLLVDLTVEKDFSTTVKVPVMKYDGVVVTKITSVCPFVLCFHGTGDMIETKEDHGNIDAICRDARKKFFVQEFRAKDRPSFDVARLCGSVQMDPDEVMCYVVFGSGMKEFLYAGNLVPCVEEAVNVEIYKTCAVKIPLYASTLFEENDVEPSIHKCSQFVAENGLYIPEVSETLYYYLFTSWGQTLRFQDTENLIDAGLQQFVTDSHRNVKLAQNKTYVGYATQKISQLERDQLMLIDSIIAELAFSYASVYLDSVYEPTPVMNFLEWPMIRSCKSHGEMLEQLTEFKLHLSAHIAANVFASNSILYATRLISTSNIKQPNASVTRESMLKTIHFFNCLSILSEDHFNDARKQIKTNVLCKEEKYSPYHLAYVCGTSPHMLSEIVWYLNRLNIYNTGGNFVDNLYSHVVNCSASLCQFCEGRTCHSCIGTAFARIGTRLPGIPRQAKKEPVVLTFVTKHFADVDVLGAFGKKFSNEQKEVKELQMNNSAILDKLKYISPIIEYCKKNSIISSASGEDILDIKSKKDFMLAVSGIVQTIDEAVAKFISEMRKMQIPREHVENSTQSFNVDLSPYATVFSPIFSYTYYKSVLFILQHLALIVAVSYVLDRPFNGLAISKWLGQQFQSIYASFEGTFIKKGFLNTKSIKIVNNVELEMLLDYDMYRNGKYVKTSTQAKLCKLSVQALKDVRVKNKPISKNSAKNSQVSVYFKKGSWQKKNPVNGCLGFLLFKHHKKLFPDVNMSCLSFWQKIFQNSLPTNVDIGNIEEFDSFVRFLISVTNNYEETDIIDVQPECVLNFIEYYFHNKFLTTIGFKDYITSLHAFFTRTGPQNHAQFPSLLERYIKFGSIQEYITHFKNLKIQGVPAPRSVSLVKDPIFSNVFSYKSLVSFGLTLEKFTNVASKDFFQFGQLSYFVGTGVDRSLNASSVSPSDFKFMRQKYVIATKLVDLLMRRSRKDTVLYDAEVLKSKIMSLMESPSDTEPETLIACEVLKAIGEKPSFDDILFYVDGNTFLAESVVEQIDVILERGVSDYDIGTIKSVLQGEGAAASSSTYDFSRFFVTDDDVSVDVSENESDEPVTKRCRL